MLRVNTKEVGRGQSEKYNQVTDGRHLANDVRFSFYNHHTIMEAMESGRAMDLTKVPKRKDRCVMILGSGHSLDDAMPLIKDWEGDIICSTSHFSTLVAHGRFPEHLVALDPDSSPEEIAIPSWDDCPTMLHTHPGMMPELIDAWKGPIGLYRKLQPQDPFYSKEQLIGYSPLGPFHDGRYWGSEAEVGITAQIPMLASVLPVQLCVAKLLGYKQQVLVGCDFCWRDEAYRFTSSTWDGEKWTVNKPTTEIYNAYAGSSTDPIVETETDGLLSTPIQIFFSHQVMIAWRLTEYNIVSCSKESLLPEVPYVPIDEVMRRGNKGVKGLNLKQIRERTEEHLAMQNIFFFYVGPGIMPHEFKDPLHDVPAQLDKVKALLEARGQGDQLDIPANLKRIRKLFKKVADAS